MKLWVSQLNNSSALLHSLLSLVGKFLPMKTMLGPRYDDQVAEENRFHPSMLSNYLKSLKVSNSVKSQVLSNVLKFEKNPHVTVPPLSFLRWKWVCLWIWRTLLASTTAATSRKTAWNMWSFSVKGMSEFTVMRLTVSWSSFSGNVLRPVPFCLF